jgi:hypothetical protein
MKVLTVLFTVLFSMQANAIFLSHCSNYSTANQPVSFLYESCLNRNFRDIQQETGNKVYLQYCMNFGEEVQYSFTSCINNNFREIQREVKTYLSYCSNFKKDDLDYSFQSCVNNNYRDIERELNQPTDPDQD